MRRLLILGLIITLSCSKRDNESSNTQSDKESFTNDIRFNTVDIDTLILKRLVLTNDMLLDIFEIELRDKQNSERIDRMIKSNSNRLRIYNSSEFKIKEDNRCDGYRHLLISKNRNLHGIDLEPYQGLYLLIVDPNDKTIVTEKIEENH